MKEKWKKKVSVALAGIMCMALLSGCGQSADDFIGQVTTEAKSAYHIQTVGTKQDSPKKQNPIAVTNQQIKKMIQQFFAAVDETDYRQYVKQQDDDSVARIDWQPYVQAVAEKDNQTETMLGSRTKQIGNVLFFLNKDGSMDVSQYYVLLTRDETLKTALEKHGLAWLVSALDEYETAVLDYCSKDKDITQLLNSFYMQMGYVDFSNDSEAVFTACEISDTVVIVDTADEEGAIDLTSYLLEKECQYLQQYQGNDAWGVARSSTNTVCDYLQYSSVIASKPNGVWYHLRVYGQDGDVQEIVFSREAGVDSRTAVPEALQETVQNYLLAMGATEKQAQTLVSSLSEESGTLGNISHYYKENDYEEYYFYPVEKTE